MTAALHRDERDQGGRIHFSGAERSLIEEDQIELTSVGVDIGSSTSRYARRCCFATVTLCTSVGPSAMPMTIEAIRFPTNGISFETPSEPWMWMQRDAMS